MSDKGHIIKNEGATHFLTFTVVKWIDVFTRNIYREILLNSIKYCQAEKGFILNAWCLMSNHIHLIGSSKDGQLSTLIRDFKKFTSNKIIKEIESSFSESRKDWMIDLFRNSGQENTRNKNYQFWQQHSCPIELALPKFTKQKFDYLHDNPVRAGWVRKPEDYLYSSPSTYINNKKGLLEIVPLDF